MKSGGDIPSAAIAIIAAVDDVIAINQLPAVTRELIVKKGPQIATKLL